MIRVAGWPNNSGDPKLKQQLPSVPVVALSREARAAVEKSAKVIPFLLKVKS